MKKLLQCVVLGLCVLSAGAETALAHKIHYHDCPAVRRMMAEHRGKKAAKAMKAKKHCLSDLIDHCASCFKGCDDCDSGCKSCNSCPTCNQ